MSNETVSDRILLKLSLRLNAKYQKAELDRRMDGSTCPFKLMRVLDELKDEFIADMLELGVKYRTPVGLAFNAAMEEVANEIRAERECRAKLAYRI